MVPSGHAAWGTPLLMAQYAARKLAICAGSSRSYANIYLVSRDTHAPLLQSSFQRARAGERTNFGRFGEGIYTSATSSKVRLRYMSRRWRGDDAL